MVFDMARVRGLYVSLSDGWTYLNAQESAQVPEKVSTGVAMAFRTAASIAMLEPATGSHSKSQLVGQQLGISQVDSARRAIADLVGATPERVVLGPNKQMLMRSLADAMRPILRPNTSVVLCRSDEPTTTQHFQHFDAAVEWAEPDLGTGELPAWQFSKLVSGSTRLVVLPAAHRLVGTITPVSEISDMVHSASRAWVLVDASAIAPYRSIDMEILGADIIAVECAPLGGPQIAALVFRDTTMFPRLAPINPQALHDSAQKLELGALPSGLLGGVAPAIEHLAGLDEYARGTRRTRLTSSFADLAHYHYFLTHHLVESLHGLGNVHLLGISGEAAGLGVTAIDRVPRVTFLVPGVSAETVQQRLLANGIVTSVSPHDPLLEAMGAGEAGGSVTIGLSPFNTTHDIDQLTRALASLA